MNRDIFISGHSIAAARWQQAIPHALLAESGRGFGIGPNDLVWLSAELPDWRSRIADLVKQNGCSVVVLSLQPDQREAIAALELGARGYAHALAAPSLLREVATVVRHGGLWVGEELIGRPHNVVRHPDMPPEAFGDLWRALKAGEPWSGYVKNRRKDGGFYWVRAFASPVRENGKVIGYESVRRHVDRATIAEVDAAYRRMRSRPGRFEVEFDEPQVAVAPGQAVVLYAAAEPHRVLGGGWIERVR